MTNPALTPTAVNNYLKTILEKDKYLSMFKIKGEISNLKYHSNGNMYFNIKDDNAGINCIMFKSFANKLDEKFVEGDQVEIDGSLYLYVKMGQYNINVRSMTKAGVGDLFIQFERLKKEFELKGYFDQTHKKPLPKYPQTIGVITAKTGAAVQDILTTLNRRYPLAKVLVYSTLVQGANAKNDIVKNIKRANAEQSCDVLIVGRGGGSIEDLWAFNEAIVVEAIWNSDIPIISSVGHETDTTLSDYVADFRAPTPTAAAELASPNIEEIKQNLTNFKQLSVKALQSKLVASKLKLDMAINNQYYVNPLVNFEMEIQQIDNQVALSQQALLNKLNMYNADLNNQKHLIDSLNPLTILSKGYSVSKLGTEIVKSTGQISVDDILTVEYSDGLVRAKVIEKELNE
ncbi:exodeoxyribonuclease VII large subunit [Mollicutes bacterium LVI A0039]|nr:exodeoxyribonuclease VII large subunit [Mollicutes bacterium LVI A0039]